MEAKRASGERPAGRRKRVRHEASATIERCAMQLVGVYSARRFDSTSVCAAEAALSEDGLRHERAFAVPSPLHEDRGGVVSEPRVFAADERLAQPAQGLGRRLTGGGLALDEPAETLGAE